MKFGLKKANDIGLKGHEFIQFMLFINYCVNNLLTNIGHKLDLEKIPLFKLKV